VLPALEKLVLSDHWGAADPDGVQRLAEGLGAGALPAVTRLQIFGMHVGDAGASALAAALGRGALPRLKWLSLGNATIGDSGLVALAPALRRLPALETDDLKCNPLGDEGLAALVAPPPPAGAPPPTTGVLAKLKVLWLGGTQVADAGCATLAAALDGGALPALERLHLHEDLYLGHVACGHPEAQKDGSAAPRGLDARHRLVGPRPHGALTVCESLGFCGVCLTPHACGVLLGERQREFERLHG
jgi:hypothetical protein